MEFNRDQNKKQKSSGEVKGKAQSTLIYGDIKYISLAVKTTFFLEQRNLCSL